MSYEKKIKDLMDRLVSMSPEPPPYPEDTPLVRPETRRSPRPALVFAAAAAMVALLAVPLLLFTGGDDPILAGSTTTTTTGTILPSTSTTIPATTSTVVPDSTTTTAEPDGVEVSGVVFLYQEPEDSLGGGNPALVPVAVTVQVFGASEDQVDFFRAWQMVVETREGRPEDLQTAIPAAVVVESTTIEGDLIIAEMTDAFPEGATPAGLLADMTMLNQLIYNLTWMNADASVLFTVNDEPIEAYGSEGLDLTDPVGRDSFLDHVHVINLTSPITRQADGTYLVEGIANVFEATLQVAVVDGTGEIVHEEFVTATCGSGCWGEFSTSIDAGLVVPGESSLRVFTYSAQDGSPIDVITVPIPEGDVWQFTVGE